MTPIISRIPNLPLTIFNQPPSIYLRGSFNLIFAFIDFNNYYLLITSN
jgi:hypothetical protein